MARNPWEDDPDLAAMRPKRSPMPWGKVFVGVILVAAGTFALAYYLPLYRAHRSLSDDYAKLREKMEAAKATLGKLEIEFKTAASRRDELEAEHEKREAGAKSRGAETSMLKTAASSAVDKAVKRKQAAVGADETGVRVALATTLLFSAGKIEPSAGGKSTLCDVAKASGSRPLRVVGVASDVPAALKAKYPSAWTFAAAAAASAAETLQNDCSVPASRLTSEAPGTPRPPGAAFGGATLPSPRVEVVIVTGEAKQ